MDPKAVDVWVAWRKRRGERWRKVGEAPTEAGAADLLFLEMRRSGPGHYTSVVLKAGEKP